LLLFLMEKLLQDLSRRTPVATSTSRRWCSCSTNSFGHCSRALRKVRLTPELWREPARTWFITRSSKG